MKILVTGGSGYLGSEIIKYLIKKNIIVYNIDKDKSIIKKNKNYKSFKYNLTNFMQVESFFQNNKIDTVIHCAAVLEAKNKEKILLNNYKVAKHLLKCCKNYKIKKFIFISSNCVYGDVNSLNLAEDRKKKPFENYGLSKLMAENEIKKYLKFFNCIVLRPPSIIGRGRLGSLSILFDYIFENRKIPIPGNGKNKYQFISADEIGEICFKFVNKNISGVFNIGNKNVQSLNEMFNELIYYSNSKSKLIYFPKFLLIFTLKIAYFFNLSPFGPYQFKMLTQNYSGSLFKIEKAINFKSKKKNSDYLIDSYKYYLKQKKRSNLKNNRGYKNYFLFNIIKKFL